MEKLVSLCIPTNGIAKWVVPVINSIYSHNVDEDLYEIVVTDNGKDSLLINDLQSIMQEHNNLIYEKTDDFQFLNQISCFKKASGKLLKFINHRMLMKEDLLTKLVQIVQEYENTKPMIYFMNGILNIPENNIYHNFNDFVYGLSNWSSWSAGLCMWKQDFNYIVDKIEYNKWFPHIDFLFAFKDKKEYMIDNHVYLEELPSDDSIKGKYNFWKVFVVEYLDIILHLYKDGDIDFRTFDSIRKKQFQLMTIYYLRYVIKGQKCSYSLDSIEESFKVFYGKNGYKKLILDYYIHIPRRFLLKILRILHLSKRY